LQEELQTPLFADGHVVGIYWENIARSIVERTHRDARKMDVPLYCLQAADHRAAFRNKTHHDIVTHSLLTVPNMHNTGKLPGILLVHAGMIVRLSDVLASGLGLVKDKLGKVLDVVLHERDQMRLNSLPAGYRLFVPEYMAKGIWVQLQKYKRSPLSAHIVPDAEFQGAAEEIAEHNADKSMADAAIFIELHHATFSREININGAHETVEVLRWQFPLIHGMLRTAYAAQGLTLNGGVVVDLRRAGGLGDDDWWLAIYVMLSRARRLTNLILVGLTEQVEDLLRRGPPTRLISVTEMLETRAQLTLARYS
jgi:hypothetical protein